MNKHFRNFGEVNKYLKQYHGSRKPSGSTYILDRMVNLMEYLGNPQDAFKAVHVTGTSGKTSTSYYIAALLKEAGKKTGLTASPHVDEINERAQIDLEPMPETEYCQRFGKFIGIVEDSEIEPTYFELLMAFSFYTFAQKNVDYAVIEVGMGGLLDGTNVMTRPDKISVITDIGLDHTGTLGKTHGEIAVNKAGIIQQGNVAFTYRQSEEIMDAIRDRATDKNADLHELEFSEVPASGLPLFQQRNWQLAKAAFGYISKRDKLPALDESQLTSARRVYIPARMETIKQNGKKLIMDGAHNYQKLTALLESIAKKYEGQKIAAVFASVNTSDNRFRKAVEVLAKYSNYIIITTYTAYQDSPRDPVVPEVIAKYLEDAGFKNYEIIEAPEQAYEALQERQEPLLLVTGSFFLLNHIRPLVLKNKL